MVPNAVAAPPTLAPDDPAEGVFGYVLDFAAPRVRELVPVGEPSLVVRLTVDSRLQAEATVEAKTQQLILEADERHRIIETALDAFMQIDRRGEILQWSSQAKKLFGRSQSQAVGLRLEDDEARALQDFSAKPQGREIVGVEDGAVLFRHKVRVAIASAQAQVSCCNQVYCERWVGMLRSADAGR